MLPTDGKARKALPIFSGVVKYFPLALAALAEHSREGNDQHNPGQPLHWAREKSTDHTDCIARHLVDYAQGDRRAMRAIAWRAMAQLQLDEEARYTEKRMAKENTENRMTATEIVERLNSARRPDPSRVLTPLIDRTFDIIARRTDFYGKMEFECGFCEQRFYTPQGLAAHIEGRKDCKAWATGSTR